MDLNDLPVVPLPGSEGWIGAYQWGGELEKAFPNQDADQLAYACEYNGLGPVDGHRITGLVMVQQGERDEGSWIWHVTLDDGATWTLEGWCDYTGWDCQSGTDWTEGHAEVVPR